MGDVVEQRPAEQVVNVAAGVLDGVDRVARGLGGGDRAGEHELAGVVDESPERQVPPPDVSSSKKSVCQTWLRRVGTATNASRRARARSRRSAT